MTVLGIVPVEVETISADRETRVKRNTILYVVEELKCTFISKATLEDLCCIPPYFPQPSPRRDYARVASVRGTTTQQLEWLGIKQTVDNCSRPIRVALLSYRGKQGKVGGISFEPLKVFNFQYVPTPTTPSYAQEDAFPQAIHVPLSIPVH